MLPSLFHSSSDGAGRSGVYLAIDANIELSEEDGVFDVYGYLKKMRQQRRGLVESLVSESMSLPICNPSIRMRFLDHDATRQIIMTRWKLGTSNS